MIKEHNELKNAFNELKELSRDKIISHDSLKTLGNDRRELLYKLIQSKNIYNNTDLDIAAYAVKTITPEKYKTCFISEHLYSNQNLIEYDPPKNGQNIIKHGLSFNEVVYFSVRFGSLFVHLDEGRKAIFSGILINEKNNLSYPINNTQGLFNTISIVADRKNDKPGYRFISSRIMSKSNYKENVRQALSKIIKDKNEQAMFINSCVEYIEKNLFFNE